MPPQSRGEASQARASSGTLTRPPTLAPFLDHLPSPSSTVSDQRTPTGPESGAVAHRSPPTSPTRHHHAGALGRSQLGGDEDEGADEDGNDEDSEDGSITLDDADFQSHYSRQSSPASTSSSSDDEEEASDTNNGTAHHPSPFASPIHHTTSSQSLPPPRPPPPPPPLYPPFYNRPPTPLPPSPSLTSLLRPPSLLNRSTTSTRPTTPDSSDAETPNDTEAAVAQSARRATVVERVAPKVPTYEYYGFVLYLASSLAFLLYILWSYLPSPFLHAIGLHYYPNRWWSLAIPAFIVMLLIYIYVALLSYNVEYLTLPLESVECIVDDAANIAVLDAKGRVKKGGSKRSTGVMGRTGSTALGSNAPAAGIGTWGMSRGKAEKMNWRQMWNEGTDAVMDVPIGGVCEILYGEGRDKM